MHTPEPRRGPAGPAPAAGPAPHTPHRGPGPRALAPDLARGVMLLFIAIANVSWFLYGGDEHPAVVHPTDGTVLDRALSTLAILFVDARVYPMFAFLFGYGMVQFATSRAARGIPEPVVRRMLARRHWWMIAFGFVHAALLFAGDILGAYGLAGLILAALFFRRADRTLKILVWVVVAMLAVSALFSLFGAVMVSWVLPQATGMSAEELAGDTGFTVGSQRGMLSGDGNYLVSVGARVLFFALGLFGQLLGLVVPACILLGWFAARHRFLEDSERHRRLLGRTALWGILIGVLGAVPQALSYLGLLPLADAAWWGTMGLVTLTGMAGGVGYAALFGLLALRLRSRVRSPLRAVAAVGKRSLSFYLLQSLIFAPLLAAWGFGMGEWMGTAGAYALAVAVWVLSLVIAGVLESRGRRGPAEALLRRLTYRRDDPAGLHPAGAVPTRSDPPGPAGPGRPPPPQPSVPPPPIDPPSRGASP
ncbi:DUF418 domain-containing protein [Brevibacterium sp. NPDC049920]|uniref:DUF418 domain-containing protein n=1 Tax=Brevibacterium pityocampae TaxID=506594 RepID=A0ABP8JD94_9MICO